MENGKLESWKRAPHPHGEIYEVSDLGRVRCYRQSLKHLTIPRIKKPQFNQKRGYWYVVLSLKKVVKSWSIHRLVLTTFKGHRSSSFDCRHLDGNRSNNKLSNLAWGTRLENEADKRLHGRVSEGSRNGHAKLTESQVIDIRKRYKSGATKRELYTEYGMSRRAVSSILLRQSWKHI